MDTPTTLTHAAISVLCVAFCAIGAFKVVEILLDMRWAVRTGNHFAVAAEAEAKHGAMVNVADLEKDFARKQPVYQLVERLKKKMPRFSVVLRLAHWAPSLVTAGCLLAFISSAPRFIQATMASVLFAMGLLILANAPLRRFYLGSYDRYNRDLFAAGGHRAAPGGRIASERAALAVTVYFLLLIYVSIVSFAGVYYLLAETDPESFTGGAGPIDYLFYSVGTVSTVTLGEVKAANTFSTAVTTIQVLTGPVLLSWLLSFLLSSSDNRISDRRSTSGLDLAGSEQESSTVTLVAAALVREERLLLAHRSDDSDFRPGVWDLIGGHVERGEEPRDALTREVFEEIGVDVQDVTDLPTARWAEDDIDLRIWVVHSWTGLPRNCVPGQHQAIAWFTLEDLRSLRLGDDRYLPFFERHLNEAEASTG